MKSLPLLFLFLDFSALRPGAAETRTCRILYLEKPAGAPDTLYLFDGTRAIEVELPRRNLSPVYELSAEAPALVLLSAPPDLTADEPLPEGAPRVNLPADLRDFYLVLTLDADNSVVPVRPHLIDAARDGSDPGAQLWFNLSPYEVLGQLGDQTLRIPSGGRRVVSSPTSEPSHYPVRLFFRKPDDDRQHPLSQTSWRHRPDAGGLFFVIQRGNSRIPRIFGFTDRREAESAEKESTPPH